MKPDCEQLVRAFARGRLSRRQLLLSLPVVLAPRLLAQTAGPPIRVRGINHVTLLVSDVYEKVEVGAA